MNGTYAWESRTEHVRELRFITYLSPSIPRDLFEGLADHCRRWLEYERASLQVETRVSGPEKGADDPFSRSEADVGFVCSPSYLWLRELEPLVRSNLHEGIQNALRDAFLNAERSAGAALAEFGLKGFGPVTDEDYATERLALEACESISSGHAPAPVRTRMQTDETVAPG